MPGRLDRRGQSGPGNRCLCRRDRSGGASVRRGRSRGNRAAFVSSIGAAEALHLWLSQPGSVERRLEREAGRNVEVLWLTGRLVPDHKTIADFRKDNGPAIRKVCLRFVELCREIGLLTKASVAIDGSKFKAVNNRDRNFTPAKVERRRAQLD